MHTVLVMSSRKIFVAEFDDDYQAAANLDRRAVRRRIRCYFLMSPGLLIHPAYVWQGRLTNSLVFDEMREMVTPPHAELALGDSRSLVEYMGQRVDKLSRGRHSRTGTELLQYRRWGSDLGRQAASLDAQFSGASPITFNTSRDTMFRTLLQRDLEPSVVAGSSLLDLLRSSFASTTGLGGTPESVARSLRGFVTGAPLVSLDTITAFLNRQQLGLLAADTAFRRRLLVLYYRANVDEQFVVAGLPTLDPDDPTIHPYDPTLFWSVVGHVFGQEVELRLAEDPGVDVRQFLMRLKQDSDWTSFLVEYNRLRDKIDATLKSEAEQFAQELELASGYVRLKLLPRVWKEQKRDLITAVLGLGFAAPGLAEPGALTIGGGAIAVAGSALALRPLRRFRTEYELNYLRRLKLTVRRGLRYAAAGS